MKIGMNMLLWTNHVTEQHFGIFEKLKKTGFDGVELPLGEGDVAHYSRIGEQISSLDMGVTCVTSLSESTNIASPDRVIREAGLERLKWAIDVSHGAGSDVICGPFHSAFAYFTRELPTADEKKWSAEMLHKAGDYAQQAGIMLTLEALNRFECYLVNTVVDLKELVKSVDHPNVGAIYDTHHANMEEKSQREAIHIIAPYLKHVHISENDRGTPGKGQISWNEVFDSLKSVNYDGWLTIEAFSTIIPEFANSINVWRDFSPSEEIYQKGLEFIKKEWGKA
jgi:D-psicose/D-tagatose/L-ribulose 3-epimerase